jgi:small subunit ribosomal protein S16
MLTIRLSRIGKKKQPSYRFIVCEKARDPWGKALEIVGSYNTLTNPAQVTLDKERVLHWISKGAQPSDTVNNILIDQGLIQGEKRKLMQISKRRKEKLAKKQA